MQQLSWSHCLILLPIDITNKNPDSIEISKDGVKTFLYNGGQCQRFMSEISDELSDTQHFFENVSCHLDYGSLTNPYVNRKASGATVLFIVPKVLFLQENMNNMEL